MPFALSPSVTVVEKDLTTIIPAVATTNAAFAGVFQWGPVDTPVLLSNEDELVRTFGEPDANTYKYFFQAANYLAYSNNLRVVRAITGNVNATNGSAGQLIKNEDHYNASFSAGQSSNVPITAKYPGTKGNSLRISSCDTAAAYSSTLSGTVSVAAGATTMTGSSTDFDGELKVGDVVELRHSAPYSYQYIKVTAIASDTSATITSILEGTGTEKGALAAVSSQSSTIRKWAYYDHFDSAPGTSDYANNSGSTALLDEIHFIIVDEDGEWTGTKGAVLEKFAFLSKASDAKNSNGSSNYYVDVLNNQSAYVWWTDHPSAGADWGTSTTTRQAASNAFDAQGTAYSSLSGGTDDNSPTDGEMQIAYNNFADADSIDVSLIIGPPAESADGTINNYLIENIAEVRKDCVVFISAPEDHTVNNASYPGKEADTLVTYANTTTTTRSSYAVLDGSYKYQYDKYNDVFRNIALAGDVAGLTARTDLIAEPWFSPAGFNRGSIKNLTKLLFNPTRAQRDEMYRAGVNPVVQFPGQGVVLFGDKTMLNRPSAFDRINVRRLFIVLEKAIATAAKFSLFEFNDEFTRSQFVNLVEPFLRDVQGRRGITDFKVVCDTSNNTGEVIDRNEFVADIFIKPARSINFITLNFIATRTGISFDEVGG
mgnify:CR=1 FL=1|jgi:hypothetical protein